MRTELCLESRKGRDHWGDLGIDGDNINMGLTEISWGYGFA